jgi:hypothetical protein
MSQISFLKNTKKEIVVRWLGTVELATKSVLAQWQVSVTRACQMNPVCKNRKETDVQGGEEIRLQKARELMEKKYLMTFQILKVQSELC